MNFKSKIISVIGLGYIGLPTAVLLANNDFKINGIDTDPFVISNLNQKKTHINEPGIKKYLRNAIKSKKLTVSLEVIPSDIYMICVPTPFKNKNKLKIPDLKYVFQVVKNISKYIKDGDIIILESTSPIGTTEKIKSMIDKKLKKEIKFYVGYCPERVLPGNIMKELIINDRIVGGLNDRSSKIIAKFYKNFVKGRVLITNSRTAEMCKLSENSYRDLNIAFANELSILSHTNGVNVYDLINLANCHPRVNILQPGVGVGGHCIAVDPWFLIHSDKKNSKLIKKTREINNYKTKWIVNLIKNKIKTDNFKRIICLGLTFKPNVNDTRESPALKIVGNLNKLNCEVFIVEPNEIKYKPKNLISLDKALKLNESLIIILVRHKQFITKSIKMKLLNKNILDFCGALN